MKELHFLLSFTCYFVVFARRGVLFLMVKVHLIVALPKIKKNIFLCILNNNKKLRSFKSIENIHKKEVGPYRGFCY